MRYSEELAKYFLPEHWTEFEKQLSHNFWNVHIDRTEQYDKFFISRLKGKKILEVGGFPGLLLAAYLLRENTPVAIDHPDWVPKYYQDFLLRHGIRNTVHDINLGPPPELTDEHFDVTVMSDVLLHNNGLPIDFLNWLRTHTDEFYMINYKHDGNIVKATRMDLRSGHNIASPELIASFMGSEDYSEFVPATGRVVQHFRFGGADGTK
jgi:hypothetical protein